MGRRAAVAIQAHKYCCSRPHKPSPSHADLPGIWKPSRSQGFQLKSVTIDNHRVLMTVNVWAGATPHTRRNDVPLLTPQFISSASDRSGKERLREERGPQSQKHIIPSVLQRGTVSW